MPIAPPAQPTEQPRDIVDLGRQCDFFFGAADARPQPGEIEQFHPITSEKGRKSTMVPTVSSLTASSSMTRPSDRTIEERIPAPSFSYLTATTLWPWRSRLARRYSRRPGFLR